MALQFQSDYLIPLLPNYIGSDRIYTPAQPGDDLTSGSSPLNDPSASNYLASLQDQGTTVNPAVAAALQGMQAPAPANVLQQAAANIPPPAAPPQRLSFLQAAQQIGDSLLQMGGPVGQEMYRNSQNQADSHQKNQLDIQKEQGELSDKATQRVGALLPVLKDAYAKSGTPGALAALQQWAPMLGMDPAKVQQFQGLLQSDPDGTLKQMEALAPKEKTGAESDAIQKYHLLAEHDPALADQFLKSIAAGGTITPYQAEELKLQRVGAATKIAQLGINRNKAATAANAAGNPANINPQALDMLADRFRHGQPIPLGRGGIGGPVGVAIADRAAQLALAEGGDAIKNPAAFVANFKANAGTLAKLAPQYAQVSQFESSARDIGNKVIQALGPGAATTGSPVFNRWVQAGRRAVAGDPAVTTLDTYLRDYNMEAAKVVAGTTNSSRAPTDTMNRNMEHLLNASQNPAQIIAGINANNTSMGFRTGEMSNRLESVKQQMRAPVSRSAPAGGNNLPTMTPEQARQAPSGTRFMGTDGVVHVRH